MSSTTGHAVTQGSVSTQEAYGEDRRPAGQRRRKAQALLAGGIVLGIGAAVTLAAWNDAEFAEGIFGAGTFNMQGSTDGETYSDNPSAEEAATLNFSAANMVPGETVYAPLWVRLDAATTVSGTVQDGDVTLVQSSGANIENLSYSVTQIDPEAACGPGATGTGILSGATLASTNGASGSTAFALGAGGSDSPGTPVQLCFAVTAVDSDALVQSESTEAVWQVLATSDDS